MTSSGREMAVLVSVSVVALLGSGVACTRKEAPALPPAAAPAPAPPLPPAPVAVRDAGPDVADAATDAADARRGSGKKSVAPAAGGGGGGMKIEGSLARANGEKVVRAAHGKLRDCYERSNPKGSGGKGRVSFKLTVDDRGHVTVVNIPTSTLPGGSEVETCMVHVLRDLSFPRGSGESTISFQMSFGR